MSADAEQGLKPFPKALGTLKWAVLSLHSMTSLFENKIELAKQQ